MAGPNLRTDPPSVSDLLAGDVALVVDSRATQGARALTEVQDRLAAAGVRSLSTQIVADGDHLDEALAALLEEAPGLVLVGGDAAAVRRASGRLAGTGTVLGTLPSEPDAVVPALAHADVRTVDVGRAGRRAFRHEASVGLAVGVADRLTPRLERRFRGLARAAATVGAYRAAVPLGVRLDFPDGDHPSVELDDVLQVTVAPRDGRLEVHSLGNAPLRQHLGFDRRLRRGTEIRHERVHHVTTSSVRVVTAPTTEAVLDGDVATYTPLTFTLKQRALWVLEPQEVSSRR